MARRTALAKQAKEDGEKLLAKQIAALRKPTRSAWLVNLVARGEPDRVGELVELGAALQQAQQAMDGDELRRLSRDRRTLIDTLARRAGELGQDQGYAAPDGAIQEVSQTLQAALGDPAIAELVQAGRLHQALSYGGFGPDDLASALAASMPAKKKTPTKADLDRAGHRRGRGRQPRPGRRPSGPGPRPTPPSRRRRRPRPRPTRRPAGPTSSPTRSRSCAASCGRPRRPSARHGTRPAPPASTTPSCAARRPPPSRPRRGRKRPSLADPASSRPGRNHPRSQARAPARPIHAPGPTGRRVRSSSAQTAVRCTNSADPRRPGGSVIPTVANACPVSRGAWSPLRPAQGHRLRVGRPGTGDLEPIGRRRVQPVQPHPGGRPVQPDQREQRLVPLGRHHAVRREAGLVDVQPHRPAPVQQRPELLVETQPAVDRPQAGRRLPTQVETHAQGPEERGHRPVPRRGAVLGLVVRRLPQPLRGQHLHQGPELRVPPAGVGDAVGHHRPPGHRRIQGRGHDDHLGVALPQRVEQPVRRQRAGVPALGRPRPPRPDHRRPRHQGHRMPVQQLGQPLPDVAHRRPDRQVQHQLDHPVALDLEQPLRVVAGDRRLRVEPLQVQRQPDLEVEAADPIQQPGQIVRGARPPRAPRGRRTGPARARTHQSRSSRNVSTPTAAAYSASRSMSARSCPANAGAVASKITGTVAGSAARSSACSRAAAASRPSPQVHSTQGEWYASPRASTTSPGTSRSPPPR